MRLTRTRALLTAFFALDGFLFANWVVCVPQVKAQVGASTGGLGLALLGVSGGAVLTMMISGRLCSRFGDRKMTVVYAAVMSLAVMLPGTAGHVWSLAAALFVFGAAFGALNVSMNSAAVGLIVRLGRPVMPSFHAAYRLGGLSGAVVGGAAASVLGAASHLALAGAFGLLVTAGFGWMLLRGSPAAATAPRAAVTGGDVAVGATRRARPGATSAPPRRIVAVFGVIALCSSYGEGALADWGALHLHLDLHTSVGLAAAGYASFSGAMVVGRLAGSWMLSHTGRTFVLAGGAMTAAAGMVVAALVPFLAIVIAGFILVGLGLANLFPAAIGEAGALRGAAGVAAASTIGYSGFLAGPPVIGFLAERTGLPIALTTISMLAAVAALVAMLARRIDTS